MIIDYFLVLLYTLFVVLRQVGERGLSSGLVPAHAPHDHFNFRIFFLIIPDIKALSNKNHLKAGAEVAQPGQRRRI